MKRYYGYQRVSCIGLDRNRCHLNLMAVAINLRRARVLAALMPPVCQVPSKATKDVMTLSRDTARGPHAPDFFKPEIPTRPATPRYAKRSFCKNEPSIKSFTSTRAVCRFRVMSSANRG